MKVARLLLVLLLCTSCTGVRNHLDPAGPRFAGTFAHEAAAQPVLRVATFNVKYARRVDRATALFRENPALAAADVILLQEMNETGTAQMAEALHLDYVYYPGAWHPKSHGNFGNAVLSRWPIRDDRKILLPHPGRFRKMQRIAVGATLDIRGQPVRVYSVHLETPGAISEKHRREQVAAILRDARDAPRVVVAGDFNNTGIVADAMQVAGYRWISRGVGHTIGRFSWDHVYARGFPPAKMPATAAVIHDNYGASDHKPVWAELRWE
jgi:endonuclease/exonuclease/phosphatase family metal-dependent hydrolase